MEVILQRMQPSEPTDTLMHNKQRSGHTSVTLTSAWSQDEPCSGLRSRYARGQVSFFFKTDVTVQRGQG